MSLYRDEAVVLRTWKLGEADRIVGLHTRRHGKVRGVAKGVRRTRSKFGARLEPMSHVAVQLHRGRSELETVTQVETIDRFTGLRSDPVRFARGSALLEAVDRIAPDREPDPDRHQMLVGALAAADRDDSPLLIWGEQERAVPLETGRRAHAMLDGSELAVISGASHAPYFEKADEFNRVLLDFLDRSCVRSGGAGDAAGGAAGGP